MVTCEGARMARWMRRAFGACNTPPFHARTTWLGAFAVLVAGDPSERRFIVRRGPDVPGMICPHRTVSRGVQRLYRCRRVIPTCDASTRPGHGPKHGAFVALYGNVGYCRRADGSDPPYQRPCISQHGVKLRAASRSSPGRKARPHV